MLAYTTYFLYASQASVEYVSLEHIQGTSCMLAYTTYFLYAS